MEMVQMRPNRPRAAQIVSDCLLLRLRSNMESTEPIANFESGASAPLFIENSNEGIVDPIDSRKGCIQE